MFALAHKDFEILIQDPSIKFLFDAVANWDFDLEYVYDNIGFSTQLITVEEGDPIIFAVYHDGTCKAIFMNNTVFRYESIIEPSAITIKE